VPLCLTFYGQGTFLKLADLVQFTQLN
jgi:hypothetical protein